MAHQRESLLLRWLPLARQLSSYEASWLKHDLVAGVVLSAMLVPAGMAYAEAAGLPAVNGLYATVVPLLVYALVGPSRVFVVGPDSGLAPLIAATIVPLAATDPDRAVAVGAALAVVSGVLCMIAAIARFGFLAELVSKPVRYGYLNGIAALVIVSQIPKLCGFSVPIGRLPEMLTGFAEGVDGGLLNGTALAIGLGSIAVILGIPRVAPAVPGVLVAVVGSIAAVTLFGLTADDVPLVGALPQGLPAFAAPDLQSIDLWPLVAGALGVAFVAFTDTSVLSRVFAARRGERVDANQELLALGVANTCTGFLGGFPVSGSSSRTPVAEAAGARTQLTGVVGAVVVVVMLLVAPGLLRNLPSAALAAIVIVAVSKIVTIAGVLRLAVVGRSELVLSIAAFLGVALLGPLPGVAVAIALSLLAFVRKAWRPHTAELVRVDGMKGYHDSQRHPEGRRIDGLVLYRFDAPLFFANCEAFADEVRELRRSTPSPRWIVVTAEPITDVDATAAEMLFDLHRELTAHGIVLAFAELKGHVRERMARAGLVQLVGEHRFYRTVGQAVRTYVAETGVDWVDWEDRGPTA
jgi:high affinity sulfate transporter 1